MYSLLKLPPSRFQKFLPNGKALHGLTHPAGFRGAGWKTLLLTGSYHSCVSVDARAVPVEPAPALPFRGLWPPTRVSMQGRISSHWFFGRCCIHYPMQFPDVGILLSREHMPFSSPRFLWSVLLSVFSKIGVLCTEFFLKNRLRKLLLDLFCRKVLSRIMNLFIGFVQFILCL